MRRKVILILLIGFTVWYFSSQNRQINMLTQKVNMLEQTLGTSDSACSREELTSELSRKVVRVIGSFAEGSGFPLNDHEIITSFHVIDGDPSPKVVFADGHIREPKSMVGNRRQDIAVITLTEAEALSDFIPVSQKPEFGDTVYAAGYALGSSLPGDVSISKGIYTGSRYSKDLAIDMVQSDISLVEGMSGGPLVTPCGEVLGINTEGVSGLSLFIDFQSFANSLPSLTADEITTIDIDKTTPEGVVRAFYDYIKIKDLAKAYLLVSKERLDGRTYGDWRQGYASTLYVEIVDTKVDTDDKNKVFIKFVSGDWVDGDLENKYFEGYWQVTDDLKLGDSNIKVIEDPDYFWPYEWTDWYQEIHGDQ